MPEGPVYVHVGLPKTGTTFLQSILWSHRDTLKDAGLLLPGSKRDHLWASCDLRGQRGLARRHAEAPGAWPRLVAELQAWQGTGLVTHEFFSAANADQVGRLVDDLAGREVHVVVTVREVVAQVTAMWQEWIKNGATGPIDEFPADVRYEPGDDWGWGTLDLAGVLSRWGAHVPAPRIHVICPPAPGEPRDELWRRFAGVLGVDPAVAVAEQAKAYESLGVAEVELLRRVNGKLEGFGRAVDRGTWIRGHLAMKTLQPLGHERFWPAPERVAVLRARGEAALRLVEAGGYDVVGDLDVVRTPVGLPARRHPSEVTDAELVDVASSAVAALLGDLRDERRARRISHETPTVSAWSGVGVLRRLWQSGPRRRTDRTDR